MEKSNNNVEKSMIDNIKERFKQQYSRAVVTGGAGFIGSHICEELVNLGIEVLCIDNFIAGKEENIEHLYRYSNFKLVRCDITNLPELEKIFMEFRPDVVFHNAASKCTVCTKDPKLDLMVNAWGTWCICEASRKSGVKKVLHASTGSVYGEPKYFPQNENHPYAPRSFYGVSKSAAEFYLHAFKSYYPGFRFSILRYFHVYGPRQESADWGGVIPIFIRRAFEGKPLIIYGDGSQIRSFTYVKDDVNANLLLAVSEESDGEAYNIASGLKISILELAKMVLKLMNREDLEIQFLPWRPGDIKIFDVDNSKIRKLGLTFETDFEKGLRETINWYISYFENIRKREAVLI